MIYSSGICKALFFYLIDGMSADQYDGPKSFISRYRYLAYVRMIVFART